MCFRQPSAEHWAFKGRTPFQNTAIWRKRKTLIGKLFSVGENSNNPAVYCTFKHVEVRKAPQKVQTVTAAAVKALSFFFVYDQRGNGANGFCGCETNAINKRKGQTVSALRLAWLHRIKPSVFMSDCRVNITSASLQTIAILYMLPYTLEQGRH